MVLIVFNLFALEVVQKCHHCQLCALWENLTMMIQTSRRDVIVSLIGWPEVTYFPVSVKGVRVLMWATDEKHDE